MRWSQLKARVEALLAPSLRKRVAFHSTRYRKDHDREGRGWITVDGIQVGDMSTLRAWARQHHLAAKALGLPPRVAWDNWFELVGNEQYWAQWRESEAVRQRDGAFTRWDFTGALWDYLGLDIDEALSAENIIIRAVAMLDRRLGRRRFEQLRLSDDEHSLVRGLYQLRRDAEGWRGGMADA